MAGLRRQRGGWSVRRIGRRLRRRCRSRGSCGDRRSRGLPSSCATAADVVEEETPISIPNSTPSVISHSHAINAKKGRCFPSASYDGAGGDDGNETRALYKRRGTCIMEDIDTNVAHVLSAPDPSSSPPHPLPLPLPHPHRLLSLYSTTLPSL
ncbi:hypothetical protein BHE74_00050976 [Ensete ventricosum]|nr:hypothetical protein GW17_00062202 [Ensete ventricosum]RWW43375.1 hypothetical protein BHE74_00050976 [Ensete ventricosum]